jgi:DNA-binding CsgD family transcriptional regulator
MSAQMQVSPSEKEMLVCAAHGLDMRQSARELGISVNTLKNQRTSLYRKLHARNICHCCTLAWYQGILREDDLSL